ncbi:MAG: dynamin family protein [Anaerolineae bacterium]|nr:dynamin family protein [Anaerolineae bacterium]
MNAISPLEGTLAALRESQIRLISEIAETIGELGDVAQEDQQRLREMAEDLRDQFFLVAIIGEFNSGKSSLINALLGETLLPVGVTPTTEAIEVIRYGEIAERRPEIRDDSTRVWTHPNTGAPGVALVDTPGTGSVFQKHEKTAKAFLHRSDLIIFVISAKRALAETERLYLELAKNYGKKIVLVVNQVDLLHANERNEVRRFIERQLQEMLDLKPLIFMVSAREALAAATNGAASSSTGSDPGGIGALKAHLRGVFSETPPAKQKLLAQLDTAERIVKRYVETAQAGANTVSHDTTKVRDVQHELEQQSEGLETQLKLARAEIDKVFDGLRQRGINFVDTNLSFSLLRRGVNREVLQSEFREFVIGRALRDINDASSDYVNALIDNSRLYWRGVIDRLNQLRDLLDQELAGLDAGVYSEQREALQQAIRIAEAELSSYSSGQVLENLRMTFATNMGNFTMWGATALIGLILSIVAIVTPGPLVGAGAAALALPAFIVGAPLAAIGGLAAYRYYRKVQADTRHEIVERVNGLQKTYYDALDNLTQRERNRLVQYGQQVLTPVFSRLEVLSQRYATQLAELREHLTQLEMLRKGIISAP